MARADAFTKELRSQLHRWGFAPMTSPEEDALVAQVRRNGGPVDTALVEIANRRMNKFNARK